MNGVNNNRTNTATIKILQNDKIESTFMRDEIVAGLLHEPDLISRSVYLINWQLSVRATLAVISNIRNTISHGNK